MKRNDELSINNFLNMLYESTGNGQRFCFVLGAGASCESGIPSGLELSRRWLKELKRDYSKDELTERIKLLSITNLDLEAEVQSEDYFDIYDMRFYPEYKNGYAALEKIMENAEPSYGYYLLAMHIANTNNNLTITTNFDSLIEDALFICTQKKPFVVPHESLAKLLTLDIQRPIIAKIHRGLFFEPKNRRNQLCQMDEAWVKSLSDEFKIYIPIVIGYGGGDNTLMDLFEDENSNIKKIYWCYRDKKPQGKIKNIIDKYNGYFVKIGGFDEFMCLLNEKFGYDKPINFMDKIHRKRKDNFSKKEKELYERLKESNQLSDKQTGLSQKIMQDIEKEWENSVEALTKTIAANRIDANAYYSRGLAKSNLGKCEDAIEDYDKAIELNPTNANAYYERGVAKRNLERYEDAIEDCDKAIELNPTNANAYHIRGIAKSNLGKCEDAIEDYDKAIELNPIDINAYYGRGVAKRKLGRYEDAIEDYNKAIELKPQSGNFYNGRANAYYMLEDYNNALRDYNQAIELDPIEALYYCCRGNAYYTLDRYEEALEDYNKAIKLDPEDAEAYNGRGRTLQMLGRNKEGIEDQTKAIQLNSEARGDSENG